MLVKVISGGQTGVDQAGLHAALAAGIATGGHAPKGYKTLDGPCLALRDVFGLEETPEADYPPRTKLNVMNSDGTIQIATDFGSAGEMLTTKLVLKANKPRISIHPSFPTFRPTEDDVVEWLQRNNIAVLNVAGNSKKTWPGAFDWAYPFLFEVFMRAKELEK